MIDLTKKVALKLDVDSVIGDLKKHAAAMGKARKIETGLWEKQGKTKGKGVELDPKVEELRVKAETRRLRATVEVARAVFSVAKSQDWPEIAKLKIGRLGIPPEFDNVLSLGLEQVLTNGWKPWAAVHRLPNFEPQKWSNSWVGILHVLTLHDVRADAKILVMVNRQRVWQ